MTAPRGIAVLVFAFALLAACGASERMKTIRTTYAATEAAAVTFVTYNEAHQKALVADAKDRPSGEAALVAWRAKRADVEHAFAAAFHSIAAAAIANDDPSVAGMLQAAAQLSSLLHDLGVTP